MAPDHHIPNAMKRSEVHRKTKREKGQKKLKKRMELREAERNGKDGKELKRLRLSTNIPRTLENTREFDASSYLTANPVELAKMAEKQRVRRKVEVVDEDEDEEMGERSDDSNSDDDDEDAAGPSTKKTNLLPTAAAAASETSESSPPAEQPTAPSPPPRILLTTSPSATLATHTFVKELASIFPGGQVYKRPKGRGFEVGRIARWAAKEERGGWDCLIVVNEDHKKPNAITIINLPAGPTAYFKLTSVQLGKEIHGHARPSPHSPELILNNFTTLLGHSVGRLFGSLFPPQPQFRGRQVVTLHCQRDFLFFRRHRYMFSSPTSAKLQEIGPRFTLKLRWLRKGLPRVGAADGVAPSGGDAEVSEGEDEEDEEADGGALGDEEMTKGMGEADVDVDVDMEDEEGEEGLKKGKGKGKEEGAKKGRNGMIPGLHEEQEYEWKWKPKMEVSRRTFFL